MHTFSHTVHISDTDITGQVYYSRPLEWLEWCRVDWFNKNFGNFIKFVEETGITSFPSRVNIDYKKPIFFGDELTIEMKTKDLKKVAFTLDYTIRRGEEIVLKSEILMVCFNQHTNSLHKISGQLAGQLEKLSV